MKEKVEKLAIFDLDDTIYDGNSHFALLNHYYNTCIFTSIFMKVIGKICPYFHMKICYWAYNRIPQNIRRNFVLPYRQRIIKLMNEKRHEGYHLVIVSNAPEELLQAASRRLNVLAVGAEFGKKSKVVKERYCYQKVFVCTDNKTDIDLLQLSDEAVITCKRKNREYFLKRLKGKNYQFIDEGDEI